MNDRRGNWYLITGLLLGAVLGVVYAWVISPIQPAGVTPAALRADFKDQYRALVAAAYNANGDLDRARTRLAQLNEGDSALALAVEAQQLVTNGGSQDDARAMALLAANLGQVQGVSTPQPVSEIMATLTEIPVSAPTSGMDVRTATPVSQSTPSPSLAVSSPFPTRTPTPTLGPPFILKERTQVCDASQPAPLIQVDVRDSAGEPVAGVKVIVTWGISEEDYFYTGLKPAISLGYADFVMQPGTSYLLRLGDGGQAVSDLIAPDCKDPDGKAYPGGWKLVFSQP